MSENEMHESNIFPKKKKMKKKMIRMPGILIFLKVDGNFIVAAELRHARFSWHSFAVHGNKVPNCLEKISEKIAKL